MDVSKLVGILSIIGGVVVGLPVLLRSLEAFFAIIPGDQPDKVLASIRSISEKIAEVVAKLLPKNPEK